MYALLGGDYVDNHIKLKIVSAVINKSTSPVEEEKLFLEWLSFFGSSEKILAAITGNHEDFTKQVAGIDVFKDLFKQKNIIYGQHQFVGDIKVGKVKYTINIRHKYRLNSTFNLTHAVKQMLRLGDYDFDIGAIFHNHEYAMESFMWKGRERIAIRTGSYEEADVFGRSIGFNDSHPIMPVVILNPHTKEMIMHKSLERAAYYLRVLNEK